ncbi:MAG: hypothetical protein AAGG01_12425, partial [Planctomycetota bacterium]
RQALRLSERPRISPGAPQEPSSAEEGSDAVSLAESFLQEAVYRSRGDQAGATLMAAGSAECGLGAKPSVVLDLSPKAEALFEQLSAHAMESPSLESIAEIMGTWVRRPVGLDRKRNHVLKDFRQAHGMDRRAYSAEELARFESGLEAVNAEVAEARRMAAQSLLEALRAPRTS